MLISEYAGVVLLSMATCTQQVPTALSSNKTNSHNGSIKACLLEMHISNTKFVPVTHIALAQAEKQDSRMLPGMRGPDGGAMLTCDLPFKIHLKRVRLQQIVK